jgi:hypothetical protein
MSKLERTDGTILTLGVVGALVAAGSFRRGSAATGDPGKTQVGRGEVLRVDRRSGECPNCASMDHEYEVNCAEDEYQSLDYMYRCGNCGCEWTEKWEMNPIINVTRASWKEQR